MAHSTPSVRSKAGVANRRDPASRERLRARVRAEFTEMPGLTLTLAQAVRLFGLREDVCVRVFGELGAEGFIVGSPTRQYCRRVTSRWH